MRASVLREYGGPEVLRLEAVTDPEPGDGQVLVRVAAAGVQFVETQVRSGALAGTPLAPAALPWTPGREVSGEVVAVGTGADPALLGSLVAGQTPRAGGYAELAVLDAAAAHPVPDGLSAAEAVSLLGTGRTAVALDELAGVGPDDVVLVESAAGAVGVLLLQLARAAGASRVIGLARGSRKLRLAEEFGADTVLDYGAPGWSAALGAAKVSVVFDGVGGSVGREAFELLGPGGRFVTFGFASGAVTELGAEEAAGRGVEVLSYWGPPVGPRGPEAQLRQTRTALGLAAAGRLRPFVGATFPLPDADAAHRAIERRETVGKTVLLP
ncbi:zinc-binding dehydrogenase [Streptacidiphilus melanogenes]|uniref:zinc-binding dehydrogenase n=1 Tax=Streptacidiphilus melanogenes TaxID=411235 RepID=UPI0005A832A2|nr:zinc-binding dehydrogenase [Streptacidiphilus melanogenes]